MDKEKALATLQSEGFDVELVSMVLMLNIPKDCEDRDGLTDRYASRLKELGYECSFGWRGKDNK